MRGCRQLFVEICLAALALAAATAIGLWALLHWLYQRLPQ